MDLSPDLTDTIIVDSPVPDVLRAPTSVLIGPAGTGKTWLAKAWAEHEPGTVLAASTGIAATNLGEGTTINALLGYFDTESLITSYTAGHLTARLGKLWRAGIRRILLDEISMVDAEQLTVITRALDELAGRGYVLDAQLADEVNAREDQDHDPIGLTLVGDFAQLPPVKAPFAFESAEWPRYAEHTHVLTEIRRQADREFIEALQAARRGDAGPVCDYFGPRLQTVQDNAFEGSTIVATNDAVNRLNMLRMDRLRTEAKVYPATRSGTQRGDWKQIPDTLLLKLGALVMILANRRDTDDDRPNPRLLYANGDLGHVEEFADGYVWVKLLRTGETLPVMPVTRFNTIPLEPGRKKALTLAGEAWKVQGKQEVIGTLQYLPLRAAWATTCHKAQGLSLDNVQVNIREGMFRQPGLTYVALSRARTMEGLRIIGSVDGLRERCTVHPKVKPWL